MAGMLMRKAEAELPDYSRIITEDDEPVDNMFSEKQQRLLTGVLNTSWKPGRPFIAASDVGIFYNLNVPPVVPDTFVSLDVRAAQGMELWEKRNRSYFLSEFGKPPEVAIEIVSNKKGGEVLKKIRDYARAGVKYYIIFDPQKLVQKDPLRLYELSGGQYLPKVDRFLQQIGLGVTLWEGVFEDNRNCWLRWVDHEGNLIPTGEESARESARRAQVERERAQAERERARHAEQRLIQTARRMLEKGYDISEISEMTGLSEDELSALRS